MAELTPRIDDIAFAQEEPANGPNSLKIVFLNAWYGKLEKEIGDFISRQAIDTDIFCLQEAGGRMPDICADLLPDYQEVSAYKKVTDDDEFPQRTYVKKDLGIISSGTLLEEEANVGLGLYVQVPFGDGSLYVCNFHGMSRPIDKLDDPARLRQSVGLIEFFENIQDSVVIGGDFNVFPGTESIRMFSRHGYRDLVAGYGIRTTRNHFAWDMYPDTPQHFSDYAFIRGLAAVRNFTVPEALVSDHEPLILEVE